MKNIKFMSLLMALMCVFSLSFTSCSDDDDNDTAAPTVNVKEANIEGDELCVQAEISAPGRTKAILINICDATGKDIASQTVTDSKYIGVLNIPTFHVHVEDIASKGVVVGDKLKLTVTDENGKSTTGTLDITEEEEEEE